MVKIVHVYEIIHVISFYFSGPVNFFSECNFQFCREEQITCSKLLLVLEM